MKTLLGVAVLAASLCSAPALASHRSHPPRVAPKTVPRTAAKPSVAPEREAPKAPEPAQRRAADGMSSEFDLRANE